MTSYRRVSQSPIARDQELATFIVAAYENRTITEVRQACIDRFGEERTPSRSAIDRFIAAVGKSI